LEKKDSIKSSFFNQDRLYKYVNIFSFPRLCGTQGEQKAVNLTIQTFQDIGFEREQITTQSFEFSDFYSTTLIKLIITISLTVTLILFLFLYIHPLISVMIIAGMSIIVILILKGLKHPEIIGFWGKYYGNILKATNVFIKIPAKTIPDDKAGNIVISAHLDSKSQSIRTVWRIIAYRMWLFGGIILGIIYIYLLIYQIILFYFTSFLYRLLFLIELITILNIIIWILIILIFFSNLLLMFNNTHNRSPGALDNASGMAIVFELSSYFKNYQLQNYNLWFCQFSAEELGTMGSRVFVNKYEHQFVIGKIFQINFDMVSKSDHKGNRVEYLKSYGIFPRKKISPILSNYLEQAAKKKKIKIKGFHLSTGAHTDCVPFHLRGYEAIDFSTRVAARYAHNKADSPDKIDPKILLEACIIAQKAILMLDKVNFP
jgi:hypothetical protein